MKKVIFALLSIALLLFSGCTTQQADSASISQTASDSLEPAPGFIVYISSQYHERPKLGETINFPFTIRTLIPRFIGDSGYMNFQVGGGAAATVDNSTIHFVLGEDPITIEVPVTVEEEDDIVIILFRGNLIHEGDETPIGGHFKIFPEGYVPPEPGQVIEVPLNDTD